MILVINKLFFSLKTFLLLISFSIIMYILFMMHEDYNMGLFKIILMFLPFFLVLCVFVVSLIYREGSNNTLFNIASFLAIVAIFIVAFRTLFDKNMVMWFKYEINYYFFTNQMFQIKLLCYIVFVGNVLLLYQGHKKKKELIDC